MTPTVAEETIRQIVRGERPLTDLSDLGIEIEQGEDCRVLRLAHPISATAELRDLAQGFLAYLHDPDRLKEWAFFIQAADLDVAVSSHPYGETLMNAVWSASFGQPPSKDVIKIIEQLA